ncbi:MULTISPECIES: hypothetical protein [unclassified Solwaraspora]|uniref:hypothetical protein n=1 Tax=unclassified Solwaraspora TaxID=2627926 RepID=UPI00259BCED5|nr:hypothetical protein [Solwaraspora sp. WMMA2056]WJK40331.1 hypothetical protein O7608_28670 [Solwaraspora sp. WMMA2056]
MNGPLAIVVIVGALLVAGWALLCAALDRPPGLVQYGGLAAVEVALLALTVVAVVAVVGGHRPGDPPVFAGYLITTLCLPPMAGVLGRMEPTRWGSLTVGVFCLVIPVLVVRLQQTWTAVAGG